MDNVRENLGLERRKSTHLDALHAFPYIKDCGRWRRMLQNFSSVRAVRARSGLLVFRPPALFPVSRSFGVERDTASGVQPGERRRLQKV